MPFAQGGAPSPALSEGQGWRRQSHRNSRSSCCSGDASSRLSLSRLSLRHDASCAGINATNSDTRELSGEPLCGHGSPRHGASGGAAGGRGASGGAGGGRGASGGGGGSIARESSRGSCGGACGFERTATHTPRSVRAGTQASDARPSLDAALARGRGPAGQGERQAAQRRSVGAGVQGRAEDRPVALSEATGDAVRRKSSAAGGPISPPASSPGVGGEPRRGWSVPRRSGPGTRRRDSLSVEKQAAAAEAAAAAARAAAEAEAEAERP